MNKKVISLILVFVMLFSLTANTMPVRAASHNEFVITADKTEVNPGDTVTYSVVIGPIENFQSANFTLVIPEGLTFVSGAVADGLKALTGAEEASFTESTLTFFHGGAGVYTSETDTLLMTFTCTVNDDAEGAYEIQIMDDYDFADDNWTSFDMHINTAASKVSTACTHTNTTEIPATESTCTEQGTTAYTTCDDCGEVVEGSIEELPVDPDNHVNVTTVPAVEGTCVEEGHEEYSFCDDCGSIVSGSNDPVYGPHGAFVEKAEEAYLMADADCENAAVYYKSCELCGEASATETFEVGEALGHSYEAYVTDPTCTDDGYTIYTCVCGDSYISDYVDALGHNYEAEVIEPTCTENGYTIYTCECGDSYVADETPMAHKYEAYVTAPTCTAGGYTTYTCAYCDESYVADEVDALGHSFINYVPNGDATCTEDGTKTAKCERCNIMDIRGDEGSATGHNYEAVVTVPTCTYEGYTTYTCANCGDIYVADYVDALGHSYASVWSKDEEAHWHACTACGAMTDYADHEYDGDKCAVCAYERDHVHDLTLIPAVQATCTTDGHAAYYTCSGCESWFEDASGSTVITDKTALVVAALGHSFNEYVSNGDATCTEDGTKTAVCDRCDVTDTVADAGSAKGHDYKSVVTAPTCTEKGYTTYTCANCGDTYTADEVAATGHDYKAEVTAPTCTDKGYTTYTCACGDTYTADEVAVTGHNYVEGVCEVCGAEDPNYVKPEDPTEPSEPEEPTEPSEPSVTFEDCEKTMRVVSMTLNVRTGPGVEYDLIGRYVEGEYVTVTGIGSNGWYRVLYNGQEAYVLGDYLAESTEPEDPTEPSEPEDPTEPSEPEEPTEPSKPGKPHRPIWNCWKGNHTYESVVTEPTCDSWGYTTYTCKYCHKSYKDSYIKALGHDWDEGEVVKAASCRRNGLKVYTCETCGDTWSERIRATGHAYAAVVTESTCEDWGYTTHTCENCGKSYTDSYTWPMGHRWGRGKVTKEATCTENGEKTYTCRNCHDSYVETIEATGHWFWRGKCANCGETKPRKHHKHHWWR